MSFPATISGRTIEAQLVIRCLAPASRSEPFERCKECRTWMDYLWEDKVNLMKPNVPAIRNGMALLRDWSEHVEAYIETDEYEEA